MNYENRNGTCNWCKCGKCVAMPINQESIYMTDMIKDDVINILPTESFYISVENSILKCRPFHMLLKHLIKHICE